MEDTRWLQLSVIITIILILFPNLVTCFDTITSTQSLTQNQTIVSSGEVFELGFFSPGNSNKWYIGIWYTKIPTRTIVWVANGDNPLSSSSGKLKLDENGKSLILVDESGRFIWKINGTSWPANIVAQILDNGNFVVRREDDTDRGNYLWQSFDHPTDTFGICHTKNSTLCQFSEERGGQQLFVRVPDKVSGSKILTVRIIKYLPTFLESWDLRIVILFSFILQTLLIFLAPFRKSSSFLSVPMWLAYLLADISATYALGIIAKSHTHDPVGPFVNHNLPVLWAPFLLVHLGGPDSMTAFALEDNELWPRHAFSLLFHGLAVSYIFIQSFPNKTLWLPTLLMIVVGLIKYIERTCSLFLASTSRFRNSLLRLPNDLSSSSGHPSEYGHSINQVKPLSDIEIVKAAHDFSYTFRFEGLIANLNFNFRNSAESRCFFFQRNTRDAFKVVEVELNFFYEILYTKLMVVNNRYGYIFRFISFGLTCASLVLFILFDKHKIERFDVETTYTLLIGAIALDAIGFIMALSSDKTAVMLTDKNNTFFNCLGSILRIGRERWPAEDPKPTSICALVKTYITKILRRRWSESICQYNLLHCCLNPRSKWLDRAISFARLTNIANSFQYVTTKKLNDEIRNIIFDELKEKSKEANDVETSKEISSSSGDWILRFHNKYNLLQWVTDIDFDENLLMWHVATDLLYNFGDEDEPRSSNEKIYRRFSKRISEYLLYLLMMQFTMMSSVAGVAESRFIDTYVVAKIFFDEEGIQKEKGGKCSYCNCLCSCYGKRRAHKKKKKQDEKDEIPDKLHIWACQNLLKFHLKHKRVAVKRNIRQSVLYDACLLAKELKKLEGEKWNIIGKVWVELLCYAASRCRASTHVAHLSKGGELLTIVWLLMDHFGLGSQLQGSRSLKGRVNPTSSFLP